MIKYKNIKVSEATHDWFVRTQLQMSASRAERITQDETLFDLLTLYGKTHSELKKRVRGGNK